MEKREKKRAKEVKREKKREEERYKREIERKKKRKRAKKREKDVQGQGKSIDAFVNNKNILNCDERGEASEISKQIFLKAFEMPH